MKIFTVICLTILTSCGTFEETPAPEPQPVTAEEPTNIEPQESDEEEENDGAMKYSADSYSIEEWNRICGQARAEGKELPECQ